MFWIKIHYFLFENLAKQEKYQIKLVFKISDQNQVYA